MKHTGLRKGDRDARGKDAEAEAFVVWAGLCGDSAVICAGGEQHPSAEHAWDALSLPRSYDTMLADVLFLGGAWARAALLSL